MIIILCITSIIFSTLAMIMATKGDSKEIFSLIYITISIFCIIIVLQNLNEPQRMKEKCVELGIGKFVADDKANVKFYFINHKNEMIEYDKVKTNDFIRE